MLYLTSYIKIQKYEKESLHNKKQILSTHQEVLGQGFLNSSCLDKLKYTRELLYNITKLSKN